MKSEGENADITNLTEQAERANKKEEKNNGQAKETLAFASQTSSNLSDRLNFLFYAQAYRENILFFLLQRTLK